MEGRPIDRHVELTDAMGNKRYISPYEREVRLDNIDATVHLVDEGRMLKRSLDVTIAARHDIIDGAIPAAIIATFITGYVGLP
jgi:hypothetical protein